MNIERIFNSMGYGARQGKLGTVIKGIISDVQESKTLLNKIKAVTSVVVEFNSDGGSDVDSQTLPFGSKLTSPTAPTKEHSSFVGWYIGESAFDFDSPVESNLTLTAHWTEETEEL